MEPIRRLAWGAFVTNLGNGAWFTAWALYLTHRLDPGTVGAGMGIAAAVGLLLATPLGHLADRLGPRGTFAASLVVRGFGSLAFLGVHSFATLLLAACLTTGLSDGGVRGALVAGLADDRLSAMARMRAYNHAGTALGAVLGGVVIAAGRGYGALIVFNAATFWGYAALVASVPPVPRSAVRGLTVVRDAPYVSLAAIAGVLSLCWGMLSAGLPLWIARHTHAPTWLAAVVVVCNAVGIAALQQRVIVRTPRNAARTAIASGAVLALSCGLFATGSIPAILLGGLVHLTGELLFVAASWGLSFPLAPPGSAGSYQGMFATGEQAAQVLAPLLMTTLVAGWGAPGWLVLAGVFLAATAPTPAVTRRALRSRPSPSRSPDPRGPRTVPSRPQRAGSGP